jgi:hypothetical protein
MYMPTAASHAQKLIRFAQRRGIVRSCDLQALDVPRSVLQRLYARGILLASGPRFVHASRCTRRRTPHLG